MAWAVLQFPGSNCDADALKAVRATTSVTCDFHWHAEPILLGQYQVIILPGGFSFGDYLRTGAIAKLSPSVKSLPAAIEAGAHVLGICNGFQILLEARLLPGVLKVNHHLRFVSKNAECVIEDEAFPWFRLADKGNILKMPIAHGYGNFQAPKMDLKESSAVLKYRDNPNGSVDSIAGIYRRMGAGSVMGLMPHPERASFQDLQLNDGACFWQNAEANLR